MTPKDAQLAEPKSLGQFKGFEVYPMPVFLRLASPDVAGLARWYEDALGFSTMFALPGDALVHLRRSKYQDVLLVPGPDLGGAAQSLVVTFDADGKLDELAARARSVAVIGRVVVEGPATTPWNTRELRVTDPVGNRLVFSSRDANPDPAIEALWRERFSR